MLDEYLLNHPADELTAEVREATRAVLKRYDRKYFRDCVKQGKRPVELWRALGDAGLLGLGVPEEAGGSGGGMVEQVAFVETLALAGVPAGATVINNFTRNLVLRFGSPEQIDSFVPDSLEGNAIYSFGLTEADAGTNSFAIRTKAERDGDEWVINGEKCFITQIAEASKFLLVARTSPYDPENKTRGLSIFAIDLPVEGLTTAKMNIDQGDGDWQYIVSLQDVRVPASALVGEEGQGFKYMFHALNPERLLASAMSLGLSIHLINKAAAYASVRAPFGKPTGSYQAVQHPLARSFVELRAGRSLLYEAAISIDKGGDGVANGVVANAAKYLITDASTRAHDAAMQAHGGFGFDDDYDIMPYYRRLRLFRIAPINNEWILSFIAEQVLEMPSSK